MTGDGTQLSPFVPDDWDELVTAAATTGTYVRLPAFAEWNMNNYYPEGITAPLVVNCVEIDGNYATIKNLYVDNTFLKAHAIQCNGNLVKNLNLVDFLHSGDNYEYTIIENGNWYNSKFSGVQEGSNIWFTGKTGVSQFNRCSLNMSGGDIANATGYGLWKNSELNVETTVYSLKPGALYRCKLTGHTSSNLWTDVLVNGYRTEYTAVDMYGTGAVVASSYVRNSIINKEKWTGSISRYTKVTSAQMVDAEYLRSIGFMAGDA